MSDDNFIIPVMMVVAVEWKPDLEDVVVVVKNGFKIITNKSAFQNFDKYVKDVEEFLKTK